MASEQKVGRNERCPCDSGKKYKNCCGSKVAAELKREEGWEPTRIDVGSVYPQHGIVEMGKRFGGMFTLHSAQLQLFLVLPNVSPSEIRAFRNASITLTAVREENMLWLAAQFGDGAVLAFDGSYDVAKDSLTDAARLSLRDAFDNLPYKDVAPFLFITLIDANSGVVKGMRQVVSALFANEWLGAVREQMNTPVNLAVEQAWVSHIVQKYPTTAHILNHPTCVTYTFPALHESTR